MTNKNDSTHTTVAISNADDPTSMSSSSSVKERTTILPSNIINPSTIPMIGGFMGGIVSTTLLLPLDIIKLRLQVTESSSTDPHRKYRNFRAMRILGGIIKYEGIYGLYQGWTPAVLGSSISWGGYFFFYEGLKQYLIQYKTKLNHSTEKATQQEDYTVTLTSVDNFVLACISGAIMVGLTNPIWLIKTRMQLQMKRAQQQQQHQQQMTTGTAPTSVVRPYNNMIDAFRTILREEGGIRALYKGSGPALLLTSHGGVQFVVYEYLRKHYQTYFLSKEGVSQSKKESNTDIINNETRKSTTNNNGWRKLQQSAGFLTMGAIAKIAATTTTYPLQLIKARMQQRMNMIDILDDNSIKMVQRDSHSYSTMISTIQKIYINEGIGGFFKGCITNAIRVAPGAAITFVVYEEVTEVLKAREYQ